MNEVGKDKATGVVRVRVNPKYYRPTEVVRVTPLCSLPPNQCLAWSVSGMGCLF